MSGRKAASDALTGRAFRIQFRAEADLSRGICTGRVEHARSGDAAHFASVEDLMAFVQFWLARQPADAE